MNEFDIILNNARGRTLSAHVKYVHPDHFLVEIDHLKLKLKVSKNTQGKLECEEGEELHSNLVSDICDQINARLYSHDDLSPDNRPPD
ncbi:hypothetical protein GZH53_15420 [Flavihumibacter sp. R14]|nr:hypothetical protein [Flavihumibacter soli]